MSLGLRTLYRQTVISGTRTVYVAAASGSDSNNGTSHAQAYATINAAITAAQAGDRILVDTGTYGYLSIYGVAADALHWVSIESYNDNVRPIISVADNSGNDGVDIQLTSFIGLYGFEIVGLQTSTNTNPSGVGVFRGSTYVMIWNNLIHDFPGGGVNCFYTASIVYNMNTLPAGGWDIVDVSFNTIYNTSKYNPDNTSGISFYAGVDTTGTTWDGRYGYRAIGNYIYNVICTVNYTPGGDNFITDGNGISCDSLNTPNSLNPGLPSYTKYGLLEGNLIVGCGARAVHIYNTINVDDIFGTYVGNLRTNSPAINNGVETDAQYDSSPGANGVTHYGCVIMPLNTPNTTDTVSTYTNCVITGGTQAVPTGNIDHHIVGAAYLSGTPTTTTVLSSQVTGFYTPVTPDTIARSSHGYGYQALGAGPRATSSTGIWTVGALELPLSTRVIRAH
jgi:hypothetical protein